MSDTETKPPAPDQEDRLAKVARGVADFHSEMLKSLQEAQPLIVLASLSLVLAAFSQSVSQAAVLDSVGASVAFMTALWFTVMNPPKWGARPLQRIPWSGVAVIGTYLGLFLLTFVASEYAAKFAMAGIISQALYLGLSILFGAVVVSLLWMQVAVLVRDYGSYLGTRPILAISLNLAKWLSLLTFLLWFGLAGASLMTPIFGIWIPLAVYWVPYFLGVCVWYVSRRIPTASRQPQDSESVRRQT